MTMEARIMNGGGWNKDSSMYLGLAMDRIGQIETDWIRWDRGEISGRRTEYRLGKRCQDKILLATGKNKSGIHTLTE